MLLPGGGRSGFQSLSKLEIEQQSISDGVQQPVVADQPVQLQSLLERHHGTSQISLSRRPSGIMTAARNLLSARSMQASSPETTVASMPPADRLRGLHFPQSQRYPTGGCFGLSLLHVHQHLVCLHALLCMCIP